MTGETDSKDKKEARIVAIALIVLVVLLGLAIMLLVPSLAEFSDLYLAPGLGLKNAAVAGFFITVVVMIVFTLAAGDGLIGELQFLLPGFVAFFLIIWLMLAWIF
jgi:hypothetical protein